MLYSISYDLRLPGQKYSDLTNTLKKWGARRILQSHWCIRRDNTTAEAIRDTLIDLIDSNDRLFVAEIDEWASFGIMFDPNKL